MDTLHGYYADGMTVRTTFAATAIMHGIAISVYPFLTDAAFFVLCCFTHAQRNSRKTRLSSLDSRGRCCRRFTRPWKSTECYLCVRDCSIYTYAGHSMRMQYPIPYTSISYIYSICHMRMQHTVPHTSIPYIYSICHMPYAHAVYSTAHKYIVYIFHMQCQCMLLFFVIFAFTRRLLVRWVVSVGL